jgi:hypothetical protein
VSTPVVNTKEALVIATTSAVAKEPPLAPVVCDIPKEAVTLALKEVAPVPYVASAVIPA